MGEIADSMINGEFDYITGEYIGKPVGYPRTNERKQPNTNKENYARSRGIRSYLKNNNIPPERYTDVVRAYFVNVLGRSKNKKLNQMCAIIQEDGFNKFSTWFKNIADSLKV